MTERLTPEQRAVKARLIQAEIAATIELYESGMTLSECADKVGRSIKWVAKYLKLAGVKIRKRREAMDPALLEEAVRMREAGILWDKVLAYLKPRTSLHPSTIRMRVSHVMRERGRPIGSAGIRHTSRRVAPRVVQLYRQGYSTYDIAMKVDRSTTWVRKVLRENDVKLRPQGRPKEAKCLDHSGA